MSEEIDVFRETPIRLLGYANEVGESFRPLVHVNWVRFSYFIASAYVVADSISKSSRVKKISMENQSQQKKKMFVAFVDCFLWQSFASVIIPGVVINRICFATLYSLKKTKYFPKTTSKWISTFVGLFSIPFIIKPIDKFVDITMDHSFRKIIT